MHSKLGAHAALCIVLVAASCFGGEQLERARAATVEMRARLERTEAARIFDSAGGDFKSSSTREEFIRLAAVIRERLGSFEHAEEEGWSSGREPRGSFVRLTYRSKYSKGEATETFVWRIEEEGPVLTGYNIQSNDLVLGQ